MKELTFIIVHLYTKSVCGEHIGLKLVSDYHRPSAWFHNSLIRLKFNPNYFMQNYTYFRQIYQECSNQNI